MHKNSTRRINKLTHHLTVATRRKVCVVIGAGSGIGATVAKRFAKAGMVACLCRRSDEQGLQKSIQEIQANGGTAYGFLLNAIETDSIEKLIDKIETEIGEIHVAVYNLGAQIGNRSLEATSLKTFEIGWRLGCMGLYRLAKCVTPYMVQRGTGTVLVTSATSAMRGNKGQHSHAAAMGGRRMLCQTLNDELASKGVHICHIVVDGVVDAPDTVGKMLGPKVFKMLRETRGAKDGLIRPLDVAETYFHLANQHRSTWTFECDIRSYIDTAWWNRKITHPLH